jgi:hypothetical protein
MGMSMEFASAKRQINRRHARRVQRIAKEDFNLAINLPILLVIFIAIALILGYL